MQSQMQRLFLQQTRKFTQGLIGRMQSPIYQWRLH
jgi:hypothetical protein